MPIKVRTSKGALIPVSFKDELIAVEITDNDGNLASVVYATGRDTRVVRAVPGDKEMENYLALFNVPPKLIAKVTEVK